VKCTEVLVNGSRLDVAREREDYEDLIAKNVVSVRLM
jgi:ribose 1,5-bisphosphokinase PhnN